MSATHDTSARLQELASLVSDHVRLMPDPVEEIARREVARREGFELGKRAGYADCDADWMWALAPAREAARRLASPGESASRRIAAALEGERADQWEHWRKRWAELFALARNAQFVRQALGTEPGRRTYEQIMAVILSDRAARQGSEAA